MITEKVSREDYIKAINVILSYHRQLCKDNTNPFYLEYVLPLKNKIKEIEETKTVENYASSRFK